MKSWWLHCCAVAVLGCLTVVLLDLAHGGRSGSKKAYFSKALQPGTPGQPRGRVNVGGVSTPNVSASKSHVPSVFIKEDAFNSTQHTTSQMVILRHNFTVRKHFQMEAPAPPLPIESQAPASPVSLAYYAPAPPLSFESGVPLPLQAQASDGWEKQVNGWESEGTDPSSRRRVTAPAARPASSLQSERDPRDATNLLQDSSHSDGVNLHLNDTSSQRDRSFRSTVGSLITGDPPKNDDKPQTDIVSTLVGYVIWGAIGIVVFFWLKRMRIFTDYREIFPRLGKFLLTIGFDQYEKFECHMVIHEASYTEGEELKTTVAVKVRDQVEESDPCQWGGSKRNLGTDCAIFEDVVTIQVFQGTEAVIVELMETEKRETLARYEIKVSDIVNDKTEAEHSYELKRTEKGKKKMKANPKLILSWNLGGESKGGRNPLLDPFDLESMNRSVAMQLERSAKKQWAQMDRKQVTRKVLVNAQLDLIAGLAKGWMTSSQGFWASEDKYYHMIVPDQEKSLNGWVLRWWEEEKDAQRGKPCEDELPILSITKVYRAKRSTDDFVIQYNDGNSTEDVNKNFTCHDQSNDVWVDALNNLIALLRKVRAELLRKSKAAAATTPGTASEPVRKSKSTARSVRKSRKSADMAATDTEPDPDSSDHEADIGGTGTTPDKRKQRSAKSRR